MASSGVENPDPQYTPHSLPDDDDGTIMDDLEPNVWIKDASSTSPILMLTPEDDGFFTIHHLSDLCINMRIPP